MGRKDRYESHVKPKLEEIKKWITTLNEGQIAKKLGVSISAFTVYKRDHPELVKALQDGMEELRVELKDALKKKAKGFMYEETKTTRKIEDGKVVGMTVEKYEKYAPPDTTAAAMLLRNYSDGWRDKDKQTADFKAQEIEIKKALAESNNFDVNFDGKK